MTLEAGRGVAVFDLRAGLAGGPRGASYVGEIPLGVAPIGLAVSPDGRWLYATSEAMAGGLGAPPSAFSTTRLREDPQHALLAALRVGESPLGLAFLRGGRRLVVADSDFARTPGASSGLTVVDAAAALAGAPAVLGVVKAAGFPRELAPTPDGSQLLVSNYASGQLEAVPIGQLP